MNFSVIVPAYNNSSILEACLKSMRDSEDTDFEIIVVDDGSVDKAVLSVAKSYADVVIEHGDNHGRSRARNTGIRHSKGEILLFIDSDVVIRKDTVGKVRRYFEIHPDVHALSGILSKEHPHDNFFSQYKNLYMNYIFSQLPDRVNFLYGSIHAVRRDVILSYGSNAKIADDTEMGQKLAKKNRTIAFVQDIDVVHLKRYDALGLLRNDFKIPFDWAKIFVKYQGWNQVGKNKEGYLHSPREQLLSVVLAPFILMLCGLKIAFGMPQFYWLVALFLLWNLLNAKFINHLINERGVLFGVKAWVFTFVDHVVMYLGIICGVSAALLRRQQATYRFRRRQKPTELSQPTS